eukprot:TRINITY_DN80_c0_g1_i6.p1 TRINITY_DN80_c0_g1~~TRINITY_DN80_c0_g1_i6.p1  ORF type:complete len:351 (-),score=78.55 TRINITY_DN80_c0_g1_i6:88-1140(-)
MAYHSSRKRRSEFDDTAPSKKGLEERVTGVKFLVPEYAAGAIIGKGGKNIYEYREKFDTYVKMSPGKEFFPNTEERVCLITRDIIDPDQLTACFHYLCALVREEPENNGRIRRTRDPDRRNQIKLLLTNNSAGLIIGKGGETIKSIQEQTATRIMITPYDPELDERVCSIASDDYENTLKATDHILGKVIKDPEGHVSRNLIYSGGSSYDPYGARASAYRDQMESYISLYDRDRKSYNRSYSSSRYEDRKISTPASGIGGCIYVLDDSEPYCLVLGVMEECVGGLVGRAGVTISEIQAATHTHIQISHKDEYIPGTRDRKVNIKGEPRAVAEAYQVIFEKVSEYTERRRI